MQGALVARGGGEEGAAIGGLWLREAGGREQRLARAAATDAGGWMRGWLWLRGADVQEEGGSSDLSGRRRRLVRKC